MEFIILLIYLHTITVVVMQLFRQLLCEVDSERIDMGYKLRSQCAKRHSKEFLDNINQCTKTFYDVFSLRPSRRQGKDKI